MDYSQIPVMKKIRELEDAFSSSTVVVGWVDGNGSAQAAYAKLMAKRKTGLNQPASQMPASLALIARTLNYGREEGVTAEGRRYPKIPARPFMTFAAEIWEREYPKILKAYLPKVLGGTMSVEQLLKVIGKRSKEAVQKAIREGEYTPLSPRTIAAKGSSTPLIDTGLMVNSVTFEIRRA